MTESLAINRVSSIEFKLCFFYHIMYHESKNIGLCKGLKSYFSVVVFSIGKYRLAFNAGVLMARQQEHLCHVRR